MEVVRLVSHLWWLSNVPEIALVIRLAALRLHRIYPFFIAYLVLESLGCLLAMLGGGLTSSWYWCAILAPRAHRGDPELSGNPRDF